jgi:ribosomal protein S18 acetylase RimI-like enzyme
MLRAERHGLGKGCTISRVFVDEDNTRALRFYHRLGYYTTRSFPALKVIELAKSLVP